MKILISIFLICYFSGFCGVQPIVQINSIIKKEVGNKELSLQNNEFKEILHLPFGQKLVKRAINENFYWDLIYNNYGRLIQDGGFTQKTTRKIKRYKLPVIKSINYFDSTYKRNVTPGCLNKKIFANQIVLKYYRYRLPDHNGLQCYYVCDYDPNHNNHIKSHLYYTCENYLYDWYGYLVFFNKKNAHADVICVYYRTFGGDYLSYARYFFIDKNFKITIGNYVADDDISEIALDKKFRILIKGSNNVVFTQTN